MIMSWKFKTLAGAQKRAAFETAHSKSGFVYYPFWNGVNWSIERASKKKAKVRCKTYPTR